MPLFIFISGYFFKDRNVETAKSMGKYTIKKVINLLVYYFIWNLIYGLFMLFLYRVNLCSFKVSINFKTLFIQPFIDGQQFAINNPAWFVPTLFIIEIIFLIIRKIQVSIKKVDVQHITLALLFIVAVLSVYFSKTSNYSYVFKIGFLLFFFQLGKIYKEKLENIEAKVKTPIVLLITVSINIILIKTFKDLGFPALYDMSWFKGEGKSLPSVIPIITSITGIWFWLRISKLIAPIISENKIFKAISNNTKAIMNHHIFAFTLVNLVLYFCRGIFNFSDFDVGTFKGCPPWFKYFGNGHGYNVLFFGAIYITAGVFIPLIIQWVENKIKKLFKYMHNKIFTKKQKENQA